MPFSQIELKHVEKTIGKMCKRRSPAHVADKLRVSYEIKKNAVIVYEERPGWDDPQQWSRMPSAKFKYIRKDNIWKLYWMRRDLKWHAYEMPSVTKSLEALVKEVDSDPYGAFFG
jgi:hypothetical protein